MSAPNDTTPDEVDTDPTAAEASFRSPEPRGTGASDTDPTWPPSPPPSARRPSGARDTSPGIETLLGGIHARAPVDPLRKAESAGEDAATYATTAEPAKARRDEPELRVPAVIVATTEPLPRAPLVAPPTMPEPGLSVGRAVVARQATTVAKRRPRRSRHLVIASAFALAVGLGVWGLVRLAGPDAAMTDPVVVVPSATVVPGPSLENPQVPIAPPSTSTTLTSPQVVASAPAAPVILKRPAASAALTVQPSHAPSHAAPPGAAPPPALSARSIPEVAPRTDFSRSQ